MSQVLFVLKEGRVAFWKISRGSLVRATLKGNRWNEYSFDYWDEWSAANQAGDSVDAILLTDKPKGFGVLPDWLRGGKGASAWSVASLGKLANDPEFKGRGLVLSQGKAKLILAEGDSAECYSLASSLKFDLPKTAVKPKPVAQTPKIVGDSYNDPEASKLAVGEVRRGVVVSVFKTIKRIYVEVDGLKEQVGFKSTDTSSFVVGETVTLTVTKVDEEAQKVLFAVGKD